MTYYEKPTKGQREEAFFLNFTELEKNIPRGSWKKAESPDFLLFHGNGVIGLEITALANKEKAEIRNAQHKVFQRAVVLAEKDDLPLMEVRAKFRNDSDQIDIDVAAKELVSVVKHQIGNLRTNGSTVLHGFGGNYYSSVIVTPGIINGRNRLSQHVWHHLPMNWIHNDPVEEIQAVLDGKGKKLDAYLEKCDECWLLIGVDEWNAAEAVDLSDFGKCLKYQCKFSRAYFLRNIEGKLIRLNIEEDEKS